MGDVIQSFADRDTHDLWRTGRSRSLPAALIRPALRKLWLLDTVAALEDLRVPPGNRLEALKGDRKGQYSIRINARYRVCFRWIEGHPRHVEIVDYHRG